MALSPELAALVDQAEAALLDARIMITQFKSSHAGKAQKIDHSDYMAVWGRAQSQPWTITPEEQTMLDRANVMTAGDFAAMHEAPGSGWNPSKTTLARGAQFSSATASARAISFAESVKAPTKDKSYYRKLWMRGGGSSARAECIAHAVSKNMALWQYKSWLWADEPRPATPGATPQARAWAEKVLKASA
jgi:hypothetical protein